MNTIKTIVIVGTLLGVGYGAHVLMNKPIPNAGFGEPLANLSPFAGFDKPMVEFPDDPSTPQRLGVPHGNSNNLTVVAGPMPSFESASGVSASSANPGMPSGQDGVPIASNSGDSGPLPLSTGVANQANSTPATPGLSSFQSGPEAVAGSVAAVNRNDAFPPGPAEHSANSGPDQWQGTEVDVSSASPPENPTRLASHHESSLTPIGNSFEETWAASHDKLRRGQYVDALLSLSLLYRESGLRSDQRQRLVPLLDQIAGTVIYSQDIHLGAPYVVDPQDTLEALAERQRVSPEFIVRTNQLASSVVSPGQRLKLVQGPFRGELSLSNRELTLFLGHYYAGRFSVALGRDFPAAVTVLEVSELLTAREYLDPATGERITAGAPDNPYGNHWIGLRSPQLPVADRLAMHGCGSAIEASDTRGCISLSPEDADDLSVILVAGARIDVVP